MKEEDFLKHALEKRKAEDAFRRLSLVSDKVDFCSNDYLGLAGNADFQQRINSRIREGAFPYGSGGSRLLAGNFDLMEEAEEIIARFHQSPAALIFNSGYDANTGLFAAVPQKTDTIIYDQLIHASIRDGIRLSFAGSFSFLHNDINDLEKKLKQAVGNIFVAVESVYSMDGDYAPLTDIVSLCNQYHANLVVDEAHATGVIGKVGEGLVQHLRLQDSCFARIHTFGKALGTHGAVVLGSSMLRDYLVNFSRPFIYTTALSPASVAAITLSYQTFPGMHAEREQLQHLIEQFQQAGISIQILKSRTPIQVAIIPGNENARRAAAHLQQNGLDVRAILYPSVPKGKERLRIVLHSFNTPEEMNRLIELLCEF
jgi:8-amino-7-oxononanoate synthase